MFFRFGLSLSIACSFYNCPSKCHHYCSCQRESSLGHICRAHRQYSIWSWFYPLCYYSFDVVIKHLSQVTLKAFRGADTGVPWEAASISETTSSSLHCLCFPLLCTMVLSQIIEPTMNATLNNNWKYNWLYTSGMIHHLGASLN